MRIGMLSWEYPPRIVGGIARHVEELSEALASQGHDVHVFTAFHPGSPDDEVRKGVHIHRMPEITALVPDFVTWVHHLNFEMARVAIPIHLAQPFDLFHAHDWLVLQAGYLLKHALGARLVATIHATEAGRMHGIHNDLQRYISQQEWALTYEAYQVIVCSQYMHHEALEQFGLPADKLHIIPNGIDASKFDFEFDPVAFRRAYAADHERIVLFVGRMVPEKGAQVLIEAVPRVVSQVGDVRFVVVGKGGFLEELKARARALGVQRVMTFTGYVDDDTLLRLYRVADVDVVPSLYEPFGIVALEGMAARLPTIVASTGGLAEIVDHTRTGLTTYPGNPDSLAWAMREVLANPGYAVDLGNRAYEKVQAVFNWATIARQTVAVYEQTLSGA